MKYVVWSWIVLLLFLRNDFWNWGKSTIIAGFMPLELLWQAGISVGAAIGWFMATKYCWPIAEEDKVKTAEIEETDAS